MRGAFLLLIFRSASALGLILFSLCLFYLGSPEMLGNISFLITCSILFSVLGRFGGEYSSYTGFHLNFEAGDYGKAKEFYSNGLVFSFIITSLSAIVFITVFQLFRDISIYEVSFLLVTSMFISISQYVSFLLRARGLFFYGFSVDQGVIYLISTCLVVLCWVYNKLNLISVIYCVLIVAFIVFILSAFYSRKYFSIKLVSLLGLSNYFKVSKERFVFSLNEYLLFWAPTLWSGMFLSFDKVGLISLGMRFFQSTVFFLSIVNTYYAPKFTLNVKLNSETCKQQLMKVKKVYLTLLFSFILIVLGVFVFTFYTNLFVEYIIFIFLFTGCVRLYFGPIVHLYNLDESSPAKYELLIINALSGIGMTIQAYWGDVYGIALTYLFCWLMSMLCISRFTLKVGFWRSFNIWSHENKLK